MTEMPATPPPPPVYASPRQSGVFGTKVPSSVAFIIGALLFFLPFVEIKCNNMPIAKYSGIEFATGYDIKTPADNSLMSNLDDLNFDGTKPKAAKQHDMNIYALAALILGVSGFLFCLLNGKAGGMMGVIAGVLAVTAMVIFYITIKNSPKLDELNKPTGEPTFGQVGEAIISVQFTPWFYTAVIAFLAAAFFSFKRTQAK